MPILRAAPQQTRNMPTGENSRAKLPHRIVLLVVLIGATMVLIFTSLPKPGEQDPTPPVRRVVGSVPARQRSGHLVS
jgi:hypothetical protein